MNHAVISSFKNVETGDMQAQGESITLFDSEAAARAHFAQRASLLEMAVKVACEEEPDSGFIIWLLILRMPLAVENIDEALEDLELVLEETDAVDDPFGEFVVAYAGSRHGAIGKTEYAQASALKELEAWLT